MCMILLEMVDTNINQPFLVIYDLNYTEINFTVPNKDVNIHFYADDTVLYTPGYNSTHFQISHF